MKELLDLEGIITVLNTPFTEDNEIDLKSLKINVKNAIKAGVCGFLVPAMASEVSKLSIDERNLLVSTVLEECKNSPRIKVIGGASAQDDDERIAIAKNLISLGCDGILVNIPYKNDIQFRDQIQKIADLNPPFLMIQDWCFEGYGIPVNTIVDLWKTIDCFQAIKVEVVPAGAKYSEILDATEGKLHTSGGWAVMQMIEGLDRGINAFMPTGMHSIYTKIHALYKGGNRDRARKLFNDLLPVLAFSNQHLDVSVHFFKRLMHAQGVYSTSKVRDPILKFDSIHEKTAEELIKRVIEIENNLDKY